MPHTDPTAKARLLAAYDSQLRTDAETPGALAVTALGSLRLVVFAGGRGFITYANLDGVGEMALRRLVPAALEYFRSMPGVTEVEWKTRAHDNAPGLSAALIDNGFIADPTESIMIGEASALAVDVPIPAEVAIRRVFEETAVRAMAAMQDEVFGDAPSDKSANGLLRRLHLRDGMELWVAEVEGSIVSAGRLDPVAGSDFAGIWGGATRTEWRGRGIYRALTAARARSALAVGKTLIHSDSTEFSRPILERSGFIAVSTTTPYRWSASPMEPADC